MLALIDWPVYPRRSSTMASAALAGNQDKREEALRLLGPRVSRPIADGVLACLAGVSCKETRDSFASRSAALTLRKRDTAGPIRGDPVNQPFQLGPHCSCPCEPKSGAATSWRLASDPKSAGPDLASGGRIGGR